MRPLRPAVSQLERADPASDLVPGKFVADGPNVYKRGVLVAQARSTTMACRIANALNSYLPSDRGK